MSCHLHEQFTMTYDYAEVVDDSTKFMELFRATESPICFDVGEVEKWYEVATVPELIKLPYKTCWFEYHYAYGDEDRSIQRYGIWAQSVDEHDIENLKYDTGFLVFYQQQKGLWVLFNTIQLKHDADTPTGIAWRGRLGGEAGKVAEQVVRNLFPFLSALNCSNVKRVEHPVPDKLQKARRKRGKMPLFSYWTLELDLSREESHSGLGGGSHASPRFHLRRGHARQYAPGKWTWIQPHGVGNKKLGMIHKEYAVKTT